MGWPWTRPPRPAPVGTFERISTAIGPCPAVRVAARKENRLDDSNDGAVATGVPSFDDEYLVFCDDIALVRRLTPALTAFPTSGLELGGGRIPLLPAELRRRSTHPSSFPSSTTWRS